MKRDFLNAVPVQLSNGLTLYQYSVKKRFLGLMLYQYSAKDTFYGQTLYQYSVLWPEHCTGAAFGYNVHCAGTALKKHQKQVVTA